MTSSHRIVLASALVAVALSACGTVTNPDVVASVDGVTLTESEFDELAREWEGDDATSIGGDAGRGLVRDFVITEALRADLAALGVDAQTSTGDATGLAAMQEEFQTLAVTWSELPAETLLDELVVDFYAQGPERSGVICAAHILVSSEELADETVEHLADGVEFAELAALSIDTESAANAGQLGCFPTDQFEVRFIPEFVDAAIAADIGVPAEPVESEFGWHVIRLVPADELDAQAVAQLRLATFGDRYDIEIDARVGTWDPVSFSVVPVR